MKQDSGLALLVQLPIPPPGPQPIQGNVPLAAAYLKLFAQRRGVEGWQIDILPAGLCNRLGDRALAAAILDRRPRLVGFTCYLWNIQRTLWIAQQLKARAPCRAPCTHGRGRPELQILLGGPEITPDNQWVLEHAAIDLAAIGEGEQTFAELLSALHAGRSTEGIPGLWTRGGSLPPPRWCSPIWTWSTRPTSKAFSTPPTSRPCSWKPPAAAATAASSATTPRATTRSIACRPARSRPTCDTPANGA